MVNVASTQSISPESRSSVLVAAVTAVNSTSTPSLSASALASSISSPEYSPVSGSSKPNPITAFFTPTFKTPLSIIACTSSEALSPDELSDAGDAVASLDVSLVSPVLSPPHATSIKLIIPANTMLKIFLFITASS